MKSFFRSIILSILLGLTMAFCYEVGGRIGAEGVQRFGVGTIILRMLIRTVLYSGGVYLSWAVLPKIWRKCKQSSLSERMMLFFDKLEQHESLGWGMLVLLVMWSPVFLSIFPGAFAFDAPTQWEQFRDGTITSHHPVLHTLLIGSFLEGGNKLFSSYNIGLAGYTITQMVIMAAIFSYTISFMKRYRVPFFVRCFSFLFFGLSPVVQLFVVSSTKDTLFSGAFMLFLMSLIDFSCREDFFTKSSCQVKFVLTALGTMILRNNGLYIVVVTLIFTLFVKIKKEFILKWCLMLLIIVVGYGVYVGPVYKVLDVEKGGIQEMLSVPLQQMARTYMYDREELDSADVLLLEQLIPKEDLNNYIPTLADVVKRNFNHDVFAEKKMAYFKLWLKWGMEHPFTYVSSFLINTCDYWYPLAIVDGYNPGSEITDFFRYSVGYPAERVEMLPKVHEFYKGISKDRVVNEAPFMFLLLSPGWYLIMTLYLFVSFWNMKRKEYLLPCLAVLIAEATALLGPVAQVRYVLILYFALPLFLSMLWIEKKYLVCENT